MWCSSLVVYCLMTVFVFGLVFGWYLWLVDDGCRTYVGYFGSLCL